RDTDFIFNTSHDFKDRFDGEPGYFSGKERLYQGTAGIAGTTIAETNFVYDLPNYPVREWKERGAGGNTFFEIAGNVMTCHVSEFPVGTYKKAHRHGPSAHVIILKGSGYSLFWPEGSPIKRYDWREGSMMVPPDRWWHQHLNTGRTPARYLALHGMRSRKFGLGIKVYEVGKNVRAGGDQIEPEDEAPEIRETFEKELAASGIECRMPLWRKKG
ncbi:MAG: ethanolamine ammonia lyase-activating protein, partial [Thermodesulfobacteriota bacterium]